MEVKMMIQPTPNPFAKKIICNFDVKSQGKVSFHSAKEADHVPLAAAIFALAGVDQVHFFENVITITQSGNVAWDDLLDEAEQVVRNLLPDHNPDFISSEQKRREALPENLRQVEEILDDTIRPALQGDGGDLTVLELDGHFLTIRYEGACGTCPSSMSGTLAAIQSVLRERFDPDLEVIPLIGEDDDLH
jgi:Fe-S cluster biogenesis protein NfuA